MKNRILNAENLATIMAKSRIQCGKSQGEMAKALGKSLGTIQNWESGYSRPDVLQLMEWFEVLGLNTLKYILDFLYPEIYDGLVPSDSDQEINDALKYYVDVLAPMSEKRKIAYCIFGNTGSSWSAQVDMLCAHNHTTMPSRVRAAQVIKDSYDIEKARGELVKMEHVRPDEDKFANALKAGRESAFSFKEGY